MYLNVPRTCSLYQTQITKFSSHVDPLRLLLLGRSRPNYLSYMYSGQG